MVNWSAQGHVAGRKEELAFRRRLLAPEHKLRSTVLHWPKITGLIKGRARTHYQILVTLAAGSFFYIALAATFLPSVRARCPFLAPFLSLVRLLHWCHLIL